jgi:AraC family cel operon transcriptional repressor
MMSPSIQLISKITDNDSDHYYHDHNFFEVFYVVDGTIVHNCNGIQETLEAGDARLLRPCDKHGFIRENGEPCAHRDIIISEQLFKKSCAFIDSTLFDKINGNEKPLTAKLQKAKIVEFEKEFSQMFFASADQSICNKEAMANILSVALLNVFLQALQPHLNGLPVWLNNILPSFSTPISMREGLDFILKDLSYDKSYVCRTFKKYMGCTMTEYLRNQRVDYASSLLLTTDKTIPQICEEIGFDSIPYFTTSFKQRYSLSPKQFKLNFFKK